MNDDKRSQELKTEYTLREYQCVKCVRIRSYSRPCFPAFELNTERYPYLSVFSFECGKIHTRITPNTDTFHAVYVKRAENFFEIWCIFCKNHYFFRKCTRKFESHLSAKSVALQLCQCNLLSYVNSAGIKMLSKNTQRTY